MTPIDLVFCTEDILVKSRLHVLNFDLTKNCPIELSIPQSAKAFNNRTQSLRKCDVTILKKLLSETALSGICCNSTPIVEKLMFCLYGAKSESVFRQRKSKPWFNKLLYQA